MKKILLTLCVLLGTVGAWATEYTVTYSASTGSWTATNSGGTWASAWKSTASDPYVTLSTGANNIQVSTGNIYSGGSGCTYTIAAQDGYLITGYTISGTAQEEAQTLTPAEGGNATEFSTEEITTLTVSGLSVASTSFTHGAPNKGIAISSFTITLENDPNFVNWAPSFGAGATITVSDKGTSVTAVSDAADNDHWYIISQIRGGESPIYNVGTNNQLKRAAATVTVASLNNTTVEASTHYLVRFVNSGENLYKMQFADGDWINSNLYAGNRSDAAEFAFYKVASVTASGIEADYSFGWNLSSSDGSRIDNNGAGNPVVFWGSGENDGGSANNQWYIYPVTINTPASTVNVTYDFYVNNEKVNTATVTVGANTEINVPSDLTAGYSNDYYNFNTTGTIGEEDCTITVTANLKDEIVYPYSAISNSKSYYIYTRNKARGGLSTYTKDETTYLAASLKSGLDLSPKKFAIISYEDNYYLYSVDDEKFVTFDGSKDTEATLASTVTGTSDRITFTQTSAPLYEIMFDANSSKIINSSGSYTYGVVINSWGSSTGQWDDGCQYTINEADDFDPTKALAALEEVFHPNYTVTYIVKDAQSNVLFTSEAVGTTNGATITTLPEKYQMTGFYTYNEVNVSITTAGNTKVEFTATPIEKPIVQYTADASNPYYYNLNIRSKYLVYNSEAAGEVTLQDTSEPFNPNASWAFIGEPYAGFKVINKTKGTDNFLTYTSVVSGSNRGNNNIQFVATEDFNDQYWLLDKNSGGFVLRMKENKDIYFHHDNDKNFLRTCSFAEWDGVHNDVGSTIVASTDEDVLLALYDVLSSNIYGDAVGLYHSTSESMTTDDINNSIAEVAEVIQGKKTSDYGDAYKALLEIEKNIAVVAPKPGFYRVKNVFTDGYLKATEATGFSSDVDAVFADAGIDDPATIVELREIEGKLYMINQGAFFNWVVADKSNGSGKAWVAANQDKYVNWLPGSAPGQIAFAICLGNGTGDYASYLLQGIYTANAEGVVVGGTNPATEEAQWIFEEATGVELQLVEVDDYGYATTCLPFAVNKIEGAKPYTVTVKDGWAVLEEVGGDQIPAGLPVVLVGENSDAAICTIGDADAANPSDENVLKGIYLKAIVNGYVLSVSVDVENNDVVGFYKMNSETALSANHAYIPYETVHPDNAEGVKGFALNLGLQDAIERLVSENADGTTYNLAGQRVLKAVKGIFIKNGKKVVK